MENRNRGNGDHPGEVDRAGVLVVDDDPLVRSIVQLGLERNGFKVWLACDGLEAAELYRLYGREIAVVLLDVQMPGLDGPQTLEALRLLNPEVQVCFMSGGTGIYRAEELLQRGAACFIAKPFRLQDLIRVVQMVMQGRAGDLHLSVMGSQG